MDYGSRIRRFSCDRIDLRIMSIILSLENQLFSSPYSKRTMFHKDEAPEAMADSAYMRASPNKEGRVKEKARQRYRSAAGDKE